MRVAIDVVTALMTEACLAAGLSQPDAERVADHYLDGELRGKSFHGVAKFCFESQFFADRAGSPFVTRDHGAVAIIDGNAEVGPLSAAFAVEVVVAKARRFGIGLVGMNNTQRYGTLGYWSGRIADHGQLGVVMNTSTADSTVAGASRPFLGVNPLSFALPTADGRLVADMSTTVAPMGLLWEARRGNGLLAEGQFVDADGEFTTDPNLAAAAMIFGGHKGFAVSLLVQVLTGSVFGFPMGARVVSLLETGYAFLAVDPAAFGRPGFAERNTTLADAMAEVPTVGGGTLRVFGREGAAARAKALADGWISLSPDVYRRLLACAGRQE